MEHCKPLHQSKTIWFNVLVVIFTVLSDQSALLKTYLSDGGYLGLLMLIAVANFYLRTITREPVSLK